jgi:hypothetical protein
MTNLINSTPYGNQSVAGYGIDDELPRFRTVAPLRSPPSSPLAPHCFLLAEFIEGRLIHINGRVRTFHYELPG